METISINGLILIISVCAITFLIGRLTSKGRKDNLRLEKDLEQSKKELKDYRSQVTSHFQETAQRVNILTENYRGVYEHLAQGAQTLCDQGDAPQLMNELNRNPMLGGETIENNAADPEVIATETNADGDPDPDSEVEKIDETREETMDSADADNLNESIGENTDQEADTNDSVETKAETCENTEQDDDIAADQAADSNENASEAPIIAAEEKIEADRQLMKQKAEV